MRLTIHFDDKPGHTADPVATASKLRHECQQRAVDPKTLEILARIIKQEPTRRKR